MNDLERALDARGLRWTRYGDEYLIETRYRARAVGGAITPWHHSTRAIQAAIDARQGEPVSVEMRGAILALESGGYAVLEAVDDAAYEILHTPDILIALDTVYELVDRMEVWA